MFSTPPQNGVAFNEAYLSDRAEAIVQHGEIDLCIAVIAVFLILKDGADPDAGEPE